MLKQQPRLVGIKKPAQVVHPFRFQGDDEAMIAGIKKGHVDAKAALYDRYAAHVKRILQRVMGNDPELGDLLQEVFIQAIDSADSIKDVAKLKQWLTSVAIFGSRGLFRRRKRKQWLTFWDPQTLPQTIAPVADDETRETLRLTYEVLGQLPVDERLALTLRFMEGMELSEVAQAMHMSLSTAKRRIKKAEKRFTVLSCKYPSLKTWVDGSSKWKGR